MSTLGLRPWRTPWVRSLVFLAAFCAAALLGRAVSLGEGSLAPIWPAAGVALLWLVLQPRRSRTLDVTLLAVGAFAVNFATGVDLPASVVLVACNVFQAVAALQLLRQWSPEVWDDDARRTLDTAGSLGRMVLACSMATLAAAVLGSTGLAMLGQDVSATGIALWWGRNLCGMLVVVSVGHLLVHRLRAANAPTPSWIARHERLQEMGALLAVTAAVYVVGLVIAEGASLAFPLLAVTVWVGLRFSTFVAALHSLLCGAAVVVATLLGHGPFIRLDNLYLAALFAQLFVLMVIITALALSTSREERAEAVRRLTLAERDAAARAEVLRTVLESMREGVMVIEEPYRVVYENAASALLRGAASDDISGLAVRRLDGSPMPLEERPAAIALTGRAVSGVDVVMTAGERDQVFAVSATPLSVQGPAQAVVVFHDVTDDRAARADLDAFAGAVAHDLKNPLGVVEGWAEALTEQLLEASRPGGEPMLPGDALAMVSRIQGSASRMRRLIGDLLAHATAGDRSLDLHAFDLGTLAREVASERQVADRLRVLKVPAVRGDVVLVRQLLDNLIGNSVTYVAPGVTPAITVSGDMDGDMVVVRLSDNGIGIPEEEVELIFERFHRAHAEEYAGTGLGLAICRRIVERHGGRIAARPGAGGIGSVFEFTLPAAEPRASTTALGPPLGADVD